MNMVQVIQQTRDEKIAMYMKLSKRELAEMLVNSNEFLDATLRRLNTPDECYHDFTAVWHGTVPPHCTKCGKQADMFTPHWTFSSVSV